ncbi:hypothetical protein [Cereibacter sediminicola]|uniref:hypothetical protein n=1 Tax=Cereibacter sediminicola TaxID=2584941 RepID=UPI0011A5867B|nr:hypothetical protein [Cereibacter sediminicola]
MASEGRLSVIKAAERRLLEAWAVKELVSKTDRQGRAFLPAAEGRDATGQIRLYLEPRDVEAFAAVYRPSGICTG